MAMKKMSLEKKHNLTGWLFLLPASLLIFVFCFYPMVQALILSFKSGMGNTEHWVAIANYTRILKDKTFQQCLFNTIFYDILLCHSGSHHVAAVLDFGTAAQQSCYQG